MLSRNQIKLLRSLQQKKYRIEHKLFIAEGVKVVQDLINTNYPIENIFATQEWIASNKTSDITITEITEKELQQISGLKAPNQILATCHLKPAIPEEDFSTLLNNDIVLYLDSIRDPGNLGTIIRTANWFGIKNIFCSPDTVDLYNPKVIQSTMGAITSVNVFYINPEIIFSYNLDTLPVYGLYLQGEKIYNIKDKSKGIIIIGSESHGIHDSLKKYITKSITIPAQNPQNTDAESLNASIAAAIAMYQFRI